MGFISMKEMLLFYLLVLIVAPPTLGGPPGSDATDEKPKMEAPCDSCCEDPACDSLFERLVDINEAIREGGCPIDDSKILDMEQCDNLAKKAIPACMFGEEETEACMKKATEIVATDDEPVTLDACKCQALEDIRADLLDVVDLFCPSKREAKNMFTDRQTQMLIWYHYDQCRRFRRCYFWLRNRNVPRVRPGVNRIFTTGTIAFPTAGGVGG